MMELLSLWIKQQISNAKRSNECPLQIVGKEPTALTVHQLCTVCQASSNKKRVLGERNVVTSSYVIQE